MHTLEKPPGGAARRPGRIERARREASAPRHALPLRPDPRAEARRSPASPNHDRLRPHVRVHTGLLAAIALAVALWALLRFTTTGFEIRAVGSGAPAVAFAGMPVGWVTGKVALLSGALAVLAGAIEVAARTGYVRRST